MINDSHLSPSPALHSLWRLRSAQHLSLTRKLSCCRHCCCCLSVICLIHSAQSRYWHTGRDQARYVLIWADIFTWSYYFVPIKLCVCVCVCAWEREREREREMMMMSVHWCVLLCGLVCPRADSCHLWLKHHLQHLKISYVKIRSTVLKRKSSLNTSTTPAKI